jgi:hypothetical protein
LGYLFTIQNYFAMVELGLFGIWERKTLVLKKKSSLIRRLKFETAVTFDQDFISIWHML